VSNRDEKQVDEVRIKKNNCAKIPQSMSQKHIK